MRTALNLLRENKLTIHQWLLLSSTFSCFMLFVRMIVTGTIEYIFLPWNLILAFVPYWITNLLNSEISNNSKKTTHIIEIAMWLLFLPNSFYIVTDLFHFINVRTAPKWFDLLLIFSFSINGIVAGMLSIHKVECYVLSVKGKRFSILWLFAIMWLSAFGIYIGRFLRFNSWDVLTKPVQLFGELINHLIYPFHHGYAWGMTITYGVFMTILYQFFKPSPVVSNEK